MAPSDITISVTDARAQLAELVNRVAYTGEQIILTRRGRAMAVLVSVGDAQQAHQQQGDTDTATVTSQLITTSHNPQNPDRHYEIAAQTTPNPPSHGRGSTSGTR